MHLLAFIYHYTDKQYYQIQVISLAQDLKPDTTMYELLTEIPVPASAYFVTPDVLHVTSTFHDHVRNARKTVSNSIVLNPSGATSSPMQDVGQEIAYTYSPSRTRRAVLREAKSDGKLKRFVEIWNKSALEASIEVTEKHGAFYTDDHVASLSFSPSESSLIYIAESNPPTATENDPYRKFRYTPQFGEGIAGKRRPTIFLFCWKNGPGEPGRPLTSFSVASEALFGQVIFSPGGNTLYATGYEYTSDHRLLGIKHCFNRPSGIWELTPSSLSLDDMLSNESKPLECSARKLTPSYLSCRSPRIFSYDGKSTLLWLSHPSGGAHAATSLMYSLDITSQVDPKKITTPLVDSVFKPEQGAFPGLYPDPNLAIYPALQFSKSSVPYLITHSIWGSRTTVLLISTADGAVKDLTPEDGNLYSWKVLNTDGKTRVVCSRSTPISPHELVLGEFNETGEILWRVLHKPVLPPECKHFAPRKLSEANKFKVVGALSNLCASVIPIPERYPTETIVIQSAVAPPNEREIRPCITMPHGGPHGTTTTAFSPANVALALERCQWSLIFNINLEGIDLRMTDTLSLPNYMGSLGFGESSVHALLGNCGTIDVEDCIASTRHLIKLGISVQGPGKQFVMGGSHGGFLTGHLIGQYPEMFSAAVTRNPVMSAGEISSTDIPDWYFAEFGESYPVHSSPSIVELEQNPPHEAAKQPPPLVTPEMYARVYRASPIAHIDNVHASVLLMIGAADLRVAPTQGIEYYHALKQRAREGTRIEMLIFEGESHPLEGVEASRIGWQAARDFFKWAETFVVHQVPTK
ncbi:hypothetical protein C0995_004460 [Termitomyces sp. Mi166|nr:hypothetical protein C0995_004460 [Termitomyces sp. Mi166\